VTGRVSLANELDQNIEQCCLPLICCKVEPDAGVDEKVEQSLLLS